MVLEEVADLFRVGLGKHWHFLRLGGHWHILSSYFAHDSPAHEFVNVEERWSHPHAGLSWRAPERLTSPSHGIRNGFVRSSGAFGCITEKPSVLHTFKLTTRHRTELPCLKCCFKVHRVPQASAQLELRGLRVRAQSARRTGAQSQHVVNGARFASCSAGVTASTHQCYPPSR